MRTLICDCNRTMPIDATALSRALTATTGATSEGLDKVHSLLCRREAGAFLRAAQDTAARGDALLVACTQESRLFTELDAQARQRQRSEQPLRFVNIRETGGWSRDARDATPKLAALIAAAQLPPPAPVPTVTYRSAGRCLVIGAADAGERAAALLADKLDVRVLIDRAGGTLPQPREYAVHAGTLVRLAGWLGAFEAEWESGNPIDTDLCTRCNACIAVCPEQAIDFSYQIDLSNCRSHRDCVRACDVAGAIDFTRAPQRTSERFDLVLDLRAQPAFKAHQPPQGYFHAADEHELMKAALALRELIGEFEKPKFFAYRQELCAHSRNEQIGCTACIDVCSAQAIRSDASLKGKARAGATIAQRTGGVVFEPHLCVGCGACATVCPSGAMSYAYPTPVDLGRRIGTLLTAYAAAGGRDAALLLHSEGAGARLIGELGRAARTDRSIHGVPARVLPLAVWHTASAGIDVWLVAIAHGATGVLVLLTEEEAPRYRAALAAQMEIAQAVLTGLGYRGTHLRLLSAAGATDVAALDAALRAPAAQGVAQPATFAAQANKRTTLELALDHLVAQAPRHVDEIALPSGAPFGAIRVDTDACTLCLACVGACPAAALADNPERPQLKFIEKNCVQCGLCVTTCPENAITLQPRLWLADGGAARRHARVLHEMEPFRCVRCGKPFGTVRAIANMIERLGAHAAFQGAAAQRLKMCSDCRVIDMFENKDEVRITDL